MGRGAARVRGHLSCGQGARFCAIAGTGPAEAVLTCAEMSRILIQCPHPPHHEAVNEALKFRALLTARRDLGGILAACLASRLPAQDSPEREVHWQVYGRSLLTEKARSGRLQVVRTLKARVNQDRRIAVIQVLEVSVIRRREPRLVPAVEQHGAVQCAARDGPRNANNCAVHAQR
jgi:hypothetical protein